MKRQMKKVPIKSMQKLFKTNISNFFMRSILLVSCNESTKVVQKKGVREIFNLKLTKNHKFFAKYPLAIPIIHANHPPRLYRQSLLSPIRNHWSTHCLSSSSQRKRMNEYARTAIISASRFSVFPQKKVTVLSSD